MPKKKSKSQKETLRVAEPQSNAPALQVMSSATSVPQTYISESIKPRPKPSFGNRIWSRCKSTFKTSVFGLLILTPFITYISCYRWSLKPAQFTVDRRERVVKGSGDSTQSYYLVWSQEGEVFTVNDSWSFLSWDSSDRYGKLHEKAKIRAKVAGWRVPFLSWYRNVIVIEEVHHEVDR